MLLELLLLLEVCVAVLLKADCDAGCVTACQPRTSKSCTATCFQECTALQPQRDDTEILYRPIAPLRDDHRVGGSDAPKKNQQYLYFVTLPGRIYRIDTLTNNLELFFDMKKTMLYRADGCGLYDIAFDTDFGKNQKVYLYYAMPSTESKYVNALVEYRFYDHGLEFVRHVATFPHTQPSSYAFAAVASKRLVSRGEPDIVVSNHGNTNNDPALRNDSPYLSSLSYMSSSEQPYIWSNSTGHILSCDWSIYKAADVFCLSKREQQGPARISLDVYRRGRNYLSLASRFKDPILHNFTHTACPPQSLKLLSSRTFGGLRGDVYVERGSCVIDAFAPAEFLRLFRNNREGKWELYNVKSTTEDGHAPLLMNTTFIGADAYDSLYMSAFSVRFNQYFLYEVVPLIKRN